MKIRITMMGRDLDGLRHALREAQKNTSLKVSEIQDESFTLEGPQGQLEPLAKEYEFSFKITRLDPPPPDEDERGGWTW